MVAAAFGEIVNLDERTILYRRHSANDSLEPYAASTRGMVRRLLLAPGSAREKLDRLIDQVAPQAAAFADRFRCRTFRVRPGGVESGESPSLRWWYTAALVGCAQSIMVRLSYQERWLDTVSVR